MYRCVQFIQRGEHHSLDVKVDGSVQELDRVLDKRLVLGMAHPRRVYGTSVMFGKGGELFVYNRFVAVAGLHRRLEIVGNNGRHNTLKVMKGILTGLDQIFLALGPYGLAVSIMTERKYGYEHFGLLDLACHLVDNRESVACEVDVHLVGGVVLDMTDDCGVEPVLPYSSFEHRLLKAIGMIFPILIEELTNCHTLA